MIELTPEQWQAISQEENPVIEPESRTAYVVLRKDVYDKLRLIVDNETAPAALLDAIAAKVSIELTEAEKARRSVSSGCVAWVWMRRKSPIRFAVIRRQTSSKR
jgi:hypothetical protein